VETEKVQAYSRILRNSIMPTMTWVGQNGYLNGRRNVISTLAVLSLDGTKKLLSGPTPDKSVLLPISVSIHVVSRHTQVTSPNVAAMLRGSDPRLRDEYIVYSAHADHLGIGEAVNGDAIYNGARDNASGTAALIEIARAFVSMQPRPRRSIIFLAPTAEEKGLLGSDYFAEYPTVSRSQIVTDLNIDGLSILYDARDVVVVGAEHSTLGAVTARAAAVTGVEATADQQPEQNWFRRSDQYSFVRRGIPSLFLRMGTKAVNPQIDALKLANEWYATRYHMPNDDLNQSLNWESGARHTQFAFVVGYLVAQDDVKPKWNNGDFFGRTSDGSH
jgi:Zn-dependent M28 family amino/carboxypeptidase